MSQWNITFNIPTEKAVDVRDTIAEYLGYSEEIDDPNNPNTKIPNPESKPDFIFGKLNEYLRACYRAGKTNDADSHRIQAIEDANAVDITVE